MKIYLLLNQPYPNGFALTKRFHLYAKGFKNLGHTTKVIVPIPTQNDTSLKNTSSSGTFENVPFVYPCRSTRRNGNFLQRRYRDFIGCFLTGLMCFRDKPDVVITSSFSLIFLFSLRFILVFTSTKLIREKNEIDYMNKNSISYREKLKLKLSYAIFHGFIVINKQLEAYLKNELNINKQCLIVPVLVEDFKKKDQCSVIKTIVYTGTYLERKDGIITILRSFGELDSKFSEYKLILTGTPEKTKDYQKILDEISSKDLTERVTFTGYLPESSLYEYLITASILIIAKPDNRQNKYNFPTKVGEYLISGRPVLATKVGILGEILENRKNVLFAAFNAQDISKKMEQLIDDPEMAYKIGERGREFALKNFNFVTHAEKLIRYFERLIK